MSLSLTIAIMLVAAVLLASLHMAWQWWRAPDGVRPRAWRAMFLLFAQAASAALLWFALFPPPMPLAGETMVLLTADAGEADTANVPQGRQVALPEATALPLPMRGAERVPDLATALRRHPATTRLHVVGAGLVARDRIAAADLPLQFSAAPLTPGLLAVQAPSDVAAGRSFEVSGQVHGFEEGIVELLDPSGHRMSRTPLDDDGRFTLDGSVRAAGRATFRLQLRDSGNRVVESDDLPIQVLPVQALQARVLAGAPNAELKFLRRWADDAGIEMDARIDLGGGLQLGDAPAGLNAATLDRLDILLVDERRWRALGGNQRGAVLSAVDRGLGLLLRLSASADAGDRRALQALGFTAASQSRRETRLGTGFVRPGDAADALPTLTRSPATIGGRDAVIALRDAAGNPLGAWRARGRGRIGIAAFDDSYKLALAGRRDAHGEAWSRLISAVARGQMIAATPTIEAFGIDERSIACGLPNDARITAPDGNRTRLLIDPSSGSSRCAGFWARQTGPHLLQSGENSVRFEIAPTGRHPAREAQALHDATQALARSSTPETSESQATIPGPRWPWFLGWLLLTAVMWWLERSRRGLRVVASPVTTAAG